MVIVANLYGHNVAMMALKVEDELIMLAPIDGKMHKYVEDNHTLKFVMDNKEHELEAYVNDDPSAIEHAFAKFDEEKQNYFDKLTSNLVLLVCKLK